MFNKTARQAFFFPISLLLVGMCMLTSCKQGPEYEKRLVFEAGDSLEYKIFKAAHVIPTPQQLAWQKLEMTAFIHFGINTFTGREWGDGTESPAIFNPTELDAGQWVQSLKDGGFKMVIITAKHHDGFCLWPTATTKHSVASSAWKNGKGDVVKELKNACDSLGMKFGVYLSPWDRNAACYGDSPEYNKFFRQQLTELLTQYGKVDEVWFDGACAEGPNGKKQEYDWASYYELIHRLQPEAVIAVKGEDVRWVGTETGYGRPTEWSVTALAPGGAAEMQAINKRMGIDEMSKDLGSRELIQKSGQLFWYPAEVDVSIRPGWFYHPRDDEKVKSLPHLIDIYFNSVGMNAVLLLNVPPGQRGLIHQEDVERLKEFKTWIDKSFSENLLANAKVDNGEAKKLIDNNVDTYWEADEIPSSLEFSLDEERIIDIIELQEFINKGQRVESFRIEAIEDDQWKEVASGTTIGYRRLLRIAPVKTKMLRLTITGSRHHALLSRFAAYKSLELLSEPVISRNKEGLVSITSEIAFPSLVYTTDGSEPTQESSLYSGPFPFPGTGTLKARAYIDGFSKSGSVVSEIFDICPAKWTVLSSDEAHPAFPAAQAIDGDLKTMWHTPWEGELKNQVFSIAVDMGEALSLKGFSYNPRQDGSFSGTVLRYSFYISDDGVKWVPLISNALFDNMVNNPSKREVLFSRPVKARCFKFISHESIYNEKWVSVGELGVITRP